MIKLLIVVSSAGIDPWRTIEIAGQAKTFGSRGYAGVEIIWIEADQNLDRLWRFVILNRLMERAFSRSALAPGTTMAKAVPKLIVSKILNFLVRTAIRVDRICKTARQAGKRVKISIPSLYCLQTIRTQALLRYSVENFEFDYLLRISSTCFVDIPQLKQMLEGRGFRPTYAGNLYKKRGIEFVGGAGILMSRDVVEDLTKYGSRLRLDTYEDIAIGALVRKLGSVVPESMPRVDVRESKSGGLRSQDASGWNPFLFRCKVEHPWTSSPDPVISMMMKTEEEVHKRGLPYRT